MKAPYSDHTTPLPPAFISLFKILPYYLCLHLCLSLPVAMSAEASFWEDWEFTGFGTLGYAQSDKYSDLILKRNVIQRSQEVEEKGWLVDSRLGLQLRKEWRHNWDLVGQVVAQEKTRNTLENSIEMAFIRYHAHQAWSFQLGRMVLDIFQLSDHRNVGYSYHWVRPPTEFYGWIPFSHFDGLKSSFEISNFDSLLRLEAYVGTTKSTLNISYSQGGSSYNSAEAEPTLGIVAYWEKGDLTLRANVTRFRITEDIEAVEELSAYVSDPTIQTYWPEASQITQDYSLEGASFSYTSLGFSWSPSSWAIQGEVSDIDSDSFGTYDGQRAYLQLGHRFGTLLPHITYSRSWDYRDYPYDAAPATPTNVLPAGTLEALEVILKDNRYSGIVNQYTISLGVRWDFASQKVLKFQCDRTTVYDGSLGIFPTPESAPRNWQEDVRTWCSTTLDWIF
ncbi:MAG: hypothetical protein V7785_04645 [Bermanella sp.]